MFAYTYNKKIENKRGAEAPLLIICSKNYYFLPVKKDATRIKTTNPTKPPLPNPSTKEVMLAITSIPNTDPPVKTNQRIVIGIKAINNDPNPPINPVTVENTFSMFKLPVLRGLF